MKPDPRTPPEFASLPKWLVASGRGQPGTGAGYVVHCHYPRFVMAVNPDTGSGLPLWIDAPGRTGGAQAASPEHTALVLEAADFYRDAVERNR